MGDPKKQGRGYSKPMHPWRIERIEEETQLQKEYGLKNKREIWKAKEMLRKFRQQARNLLADTSEEAEKEKKDLLKRLGKLGIVESENIEDILALTPSKILDRRLQTIVHKKGFSSTPKQARQLVKHRHVQVKGRKVDVPGYLVVKTEEDLISLTDEYAKKVAQ